MTLLLWIFSPEVPGLSIIWGLSPAGALGPHLKIIKVFIPNGAL